MYRTVKLKFAGEDDLRTIFWRIFSNTRPSKLDSSFLGTRLLMMTALIMSLCSLPKSSAYSITSSLGPSYDFDPFNPSTGRSTRMPWGSTAQQQQQPHSSANTNSQSNNNNNNNNYRDNRYNNNDNLMGPYVRHANGGDETEDSPPNNQYTRTQLQVAGRILFESRVTTPKPLLGFRSYLSSYRNRNYYVKKAKTNHNDFVYSNPNSKTFFPNLDANNNNEDDTAEQLHPRPPHVRSHGDSNSSSSSTVPVGSLDNLHVQGVVGLGGGGGGAVSFDSASSPLFVTTPESKTAPATVVSPASATERPSSTQQMQSDGPYYSGTLASSASSHHYQYNRGEQFVSGLSNDKRPVQIASPAPSRQYPSKVGGGGVVGSERHYLTDDGDKPDAYEDFDSTSQFFPEEVGGVQEEPIVFPTTVKTNHRTYKIPTHSWEDSELAGLKSILEMRNGGDLAVGQGNATTSFNSSRRDNFPKGHFSPIVEGAKEPDCAKKLGYCDNIDNYPKELLSTVLTNSISSDVFQKVFGDDTAGVGAHKASGAQLHDVVLAGRNGLTQETPLCASQEVTIYPRVARNKEDKWMFIVNHDDYVQGVKVEKCMKEGSSCLFSEGNPLGYESVCRQKFILRKLVALNGEGKTALDTFKLPSCCVCYIKSNYVSERFGSISSASSSSSLKSDAGSSSSSSGVHDADSPAEDQNNEEGVNDSPPVACIEKKSTTDTVNSTSSHLQQSTESFVVSPNATAFNTTLS